MNKLRATYINKTFNWMAYTSDCTEPDLEPRLIDGVYRAIFFLPIINKTIIGLGETKLLAIDNASKECARHIDEYLNNHPEFEFKDELTKSQYVLTEDGETITMVLCEFDTIQLMN